MGYRFGSIVRGVVRNLKKGESKIVKKKGESKMVKKKGEDAYDMLHDIMYPEKSIEEILQEKVDAYKTKYNRFPPAITLEKARYYEYCKMLGTSGTKATKVINPKFERIPVYNQDDCITTKVSCVKCHLYEKYGRDLQDLGHYKAGLTNEEIEDYIKERNKGKMTKTIMKKFQKIAGINTVGVGPEGQSLMYRWDVKRFADQMFDGKPTYWD